MRASSTIPERVAGRLIVTDTRIPEASIGAANGQTSAGTRRMGRVPARRHRRRAVQERNCHDHPHPTP